jgi:hypothetical protein
MKIFAANTVIARSRFWYYLAALKKVKKANGEIVEIHEVSSKDQRQTIARVADRPIRPPRTRASVERSAASEHATATTLEQREAAHRRTRCSSDPPVRLASLPLTDLREEPELHQELR